MADQDDASAVTKPERVECKRDWWTTVLPAAFAVIGTLAGSLIGARVADKTLRESRDADLREQEETRAGEQREQQANAYVVFLNAADASNDAIGTYELCEGVCEGQRAEAWDRSDAADEAFGLVHIYGSLDTYHAGRAMLDHVQERYENRLSGNPAADGDARYREMKVVYLGKVCEDVNALEVPC